MIGVGVLVFTLLGYATAAAIFAIAGWQPINATDGGPGLGIALALVVLMVSLLALGLLLVIVALIGGVIFPAIGARLHKRPHNTRA